jgi:hypothetical protein
LYTLVVRDFKARSSSTDFACEHNRPYANSE